MTSMQKHPRFKTVTEVELLAAAAAGGPLRMFADNISLGGIFVRTDRPVAPGTPVKLRVAAASGPIILNGKVVHVVDSLRARHLRTSPGMGLQFSDMAPESRAALARFVDGLAQQAKARSDAALLAQEAPVARFIAPMMVEVEVKDRAGAKRLWDDELSRAGLFARGDVPTLRSQVRVHIVGPGGRLAMQAEVVAVVAQGAGLQLLDFDGDTRAVFMDFIAGRTTSLAPAAMAPVHTEAVVPGVMPAQVQAALLAARVLFDGIAKGDVHSALGMRPSPSGSAVRPGAASAAEDARISDLKRTFAAGRLLASPTQRARIEHAVKTLLQMERRFVMERAALHREGELVERSARAPSLAMQVESDALVRRADEDEARKDLASAKKSLDRALQLSPNDPDIRKKHARVTTLLDESRAIDDIAAAEVYCEHAGMKAQAKALALSAIEKSASRAIRARGLSVLLRSEALNDAFVIAQELLGDDPNDPLPLCALLILYERKGHIALAARTAAKLCELRPDDKDMKSRLRRLRGLLPR